jgi:uncharacterized membrane protein YccC
MSAKSGLPFAGYAADVWDVVFSIKTFIAAMLALFVALTFDLTNPYWAVGTVYIVAHPLSGASTSKAVYRLLGTAIGGAMTVALVPNLVNAPELLTLAIALWIGICLAVSLLDRTPRSYVFMLAGYTTALTGFPIVAAPETAFTYASGRVIEIGVGIICTAVVSRLLFPRHAGPVLSARIDAWMKNAGLLAVDALKGSAQATLVAPARRLASEAVELRIFTIHVAYDTSDMRDILGLTKTLQQRMVALLPVASSLADVIAVLKLEGNGAQRPAVEALVADVSAWLESGQSLTEVQRQHVLALMEKAELDASGGSEWHGLLLQNLMARLRDLSQIWSDCIDLKQDISSGSQHFLRWNRFGPGLDQRPMHKDYGMAALSGFSAMLATCLACAFWVLTGWPQGSGAAMMASVLCCLFASMDDPTPMIRKFLQVSLVAVVAAFVLTFAIMPLIHGYVSLVALLGICLLPAGVLMAKPQTLLYGLGFGVNLPNMLTLQDRLTLDFTSFVNSNISLVVGVTIACGTTALVRSVGSEWSVQRLRRAGWRDIAAVARRRQGDDVTGLLHRMLDRLGLVAPRLANLPSDAGSPRTDMLQDLRVGLDVVELQQHKFLLPPICSKAVDEVLVCVAGYYRTHHRQDTAGPNADMLGPLDTAIAVLVDARDEPAVAKLRRSLVGIRYNLFSAAPAFSSTPRHSLQDAAE